MTERILIGVAWPYANGWLHLGHIAGCYLPADIFSRYHRLMGNDVLMVSGSDQHGTPVTIRAEQEGLTPQEVVDKYHASFLRCWDQLGIQFDLFTTTGTDNHREVVQDIFLTLRDKGYIYTDTMSLPYCDACHRFLPDRYVEGTCPNCGSPDARGDQCDNCGKTTNPEDLIDMRCRICGSHPYMAQSEHFFLKLSAFQERLLDWVRLQTHWRPNVLKFTLGFLGGGLKDRAISRDILWGVPLPVPGYEEKRIYVWFEAVIGYLSAAKEWAQRRGEPERWRDFWQKECKVYNFIGKDNIPFHSLIWPAILMGYSGLNLPYDVPANEFLTLEGRQLSTSRNWAVWLPDYLERYAPDPLRYCLSANMPETGDTDFSWAEFQRRNNDELVATYGNLVHRTLTFTYRNFQGQVPEPGALETLDQQLLDAAGTALETVGKSLSECRFRLAITQAMGLARQANKYLDSREPWRAIKNGQQGAATTLWVTLSVINCLKVLLYPFMPFSSERLHTMLGFGGSTTERGWQWSGNRDGLPPGQALSKPEPLFTKLEDEVIEREIERMHVQPV